MLRMYNCSQDADHLFETYDEAIEDFLSMVDNEYFNRLCLEIPLRVYRYQPVEVPRVDGQCILDRVLELMDEDYLPETMEPTEATDVMYMAVEEFIEKIQEEYPRRAYKLAKGEEFEVNVLIWIANNNPHWIKKVER